MPNTSADPMTRIDFMVTDPLLQKALELASVDGYTPGAFHRIIWAIGLDAYAERMNKRLVNSQLLAKNP